MNAQSRTIDFGNWTTQVRKGLLELCIVNLLARGELYGYDLVKKLAEIKGLVVTEGTIYPLLSRLRKAGVLKTRLEESSSGPVRKYYSLTREGYQDRARLNAYWKDLSQGVSELLREKETNHGRLDTRSK
jgi:PadR family transcriptional regulator, regulatory protein PadR